MRMNWSLSLRFSALRLRLYAPFNASFTLTAYVQPGGSSAASIQRSGR